MTIEVFSIERPKNELEEAALEWAYALVPETHDLMIDADERLPEKYIGSDNETEALEELSKSFEKYGRELAKMVELLLAGKAVVIKTEDLEKLQA